MTLSELLRDSLSDALGQTEAAKTAEPEAVPSGFSSEEVKKLSSFLEDFASNYGQLIETIDKEAGNINWDKEKRHGKALEALEGQSPEDLKETAKTMSKSKANAILNLQRKRVSTQRALNRAQSLAGSGKGMSMGTGKMLLLTGLGAGVGGALLGSQMQRNKDIRDMQAAMYTQPSVGGA